LFVNSSYRTEKITNRSNLKLNCVLNTQLAQITTSNDNICSNGPLQFVSYIAWHANSVVLEWRWDMVYPANITTRTRTHTPLSLSLTGFLV